MKKFCEKTSEQNKDPVFHIVLTVENVLSEEECKWIMTEIDKTGDRHGWQVKRNDPDVTKGLDVNKIDSLSYFAMSLVYSYIIPLVNRVRKN
jgi:hypothetical protein